MSVLNTLAKSHIGVDPHQDKTEIARQIAPLFSKMQEQGYTISVHDADVEGKSNFDDTDLASRCHFKIRVFSPRTQRAISLYIDPQKTVEVLSREIELGLAVDEAKHLNLVGDHHTEVFGFSPSKNRILVNRKGKGVNWLDVTIGPIYDFNSHYLNIKNINDTIARYFRKQNANNFMALFFAPVQYKGGIFNVSSMEPSEKSMKALEKSVLPLDNFTKLCRSVKNIDGCTQVGHSPNQSTFTFTVEQHPHRYTFEYDVTYKGTNALGREIELDLALIHALPKSGFYNLEARDNGRYIVATQFDGKSMTIDTAVVYDYQGHILSLRNLQRLFGLEETLGSVPSKYHYQDGIIFDQGEKMRFLANFAKEMQKDSVDASARSLSPLLEEIDFDDMLLGEMQLVDPRGQPTPTSDESGIFSDNPDDFMHVDLPMDILGQTQSAAQNSAASNIDEMDVDALPPTAFLDPAFTGGSFDGFEFDM